MSCSWCVIDITGHRVVQKPCIIVVVCLGGSCQMVAAGLQALSDRLDDVPAKHWDSERLVAAMQAGSYTIATACIQVV